MTRHYDVSRRPHFDGRIGGFNFCNFGRLFLKSIKNSSFFVITFTLLYDSSAFSLVPSHLGQFNFVFTHFTDLKMIPFICIAHSFWATSAHVGKLQVFIDAKPRELITKWLSSRKRTPI